MDNNRKRESLNAAHDQGMRYRLLPRAGWVTKGSRAKSNHTVLVPREEIVQLAYDHYSALFASKALAYENVNLRHYLEMLAKGEHDAVTCEKCHGVYQRGWLKGKCIYCEAQDAAFSMIRRPEPGGEG